MKDKILIDTSAWIASFKKSGNKKLKEKVIEALSSFSAVTTNIIVLELLQGCRDKEEYNAMRSRLEALENLPLNDDVWQIAYITGYELRKKGITVPTIDIIIASIAKNYGCYLLHYDKHFRIIAEQLDIVTIDFLDEKT